VFSLLQIFIRPREVFQRVRKRKIWALPLLATVFLTFLTTYLTVSMAGMELITLQHFQHDQGLSDRVGEQTVDNAVNSSNSRVPKMIFLSRAGGSMMAGLLALAGVFMIAAVAMEANPRAGYAQMLGMASYAFFPFALLQMIVTAIILSISLDHSSLDLDNLTGVNVGRLFDRAAASPALFELAAGLDLVSAVQVVFLAFGFSRTAALPFGRCLAVCGALWAVLILWKAALAAFF
jgi:hypothetical protein